MDLTIDFLLAAIQPGFVIALIVGAILINHWVFNKFVSNFKNAAITKSTIIVFIVLIGLLIFLLTLPVEKELKGQIIGFFGIIISAGIALSSTNLLGNLIAGIMNNSMKRFRNGDLIRIEDVEGRVTEKSVFHTEIQLEDSNFITIPNLYIANNPVKLTRKSNTVISTTVSLGYDVSRTKIMEALKNAAERTGLSDPYVYVTSLGDYSIVYKIHGFLGDSSKYFSTSSDLNINVLDCLHEENIEIVSPSFMNQRQVNDVQFIPKVIHTENISSNTPERSPEELIFDEAIKSEKLEIKKDYLKELEAKEKAYRDKLELAKTDAETEQLKTLIARYENLKEKIAESIDEQSKRNKENA